MIQVMNQNEEKIVELEARRDSINIGDVVGFGINAAYLAWIGGEIAKYAKHVDGNQALCQVREVPEKLINELALYPFYSDADVSRKISHCFTSEETKKKALEIMEKSGLKEIFATKGDLVFQEVEGGFVFNIDEYQKNCLAKLSEIDFADKVDKCKEQLTELFQSVNKSTGSLINNIEEHYPYGIKGAVATFAILGGIAMAVSNKMAVNTSIDNQINKLELKELANDVNHLKANSKIDPQTVSLDGLRVEIENAKTDEPTLMR
jgi:hypothetical protein